LQEEDQQVYNMETGRQNVKREMGMGIRRKREEEK
jgi:hypothetical protein